MAVSVVIEDWVTVSALIEDWTEAVSAGSLVSLFIGVLADVAVNIVVSLPLAGAGVGAK